ncbi:class I adenylate-forming enzyme family protein [Amycolatopsis acidicola]|nr:class I adenylate-forming enzyme family protein [Amycolatopsis acidicola]
MTSRIPACTPARLAARAAERPGEVALEVVGAGRLTFREWDERSSAAARGLVAGGIRPGDRVVVWGDNADLLDYAVSYLAVHKAGAVAVPVQRRSGQNHLRQVCEKSGAVVILGVVPDADLPVRGVPVRTLEVGQSTQPLPLRACPRDDAEILFTAGTTGVPKGVVASHECVLCTHEPVATAREPHVVLHALQPASLAGQGLLLQPLDGVPHRVIALPAYDDRGFGAAIEYYRPTHVVLVPAQASSLVDSVVDTPSVRVVRTISAPIAPATLAGLAALFPGAATINMYTSTEAFPARVKITFDPVRPASVGRSVHVRVVDDAGTPLAPNEPGNIELRAPHAPRRRYLDADASVFRPDGWVRTGDLGFLDARGFLFLLDRHQDLVISGGLNISTIEVETVLQEFPGIREAAAFALPDPALGEYVAAAIVTGPVFDQAGLSEFLLDRLGPARLPKRLLYAKALPRNELGKVLKRQLRDEAARRLGVRGFVLKEKPWPPNGLKRSA